MAMTRAVCIFAGAGCSRALADLPIQADLAGALLKWEDGRGIHPHFSPDLRRLLEELQDLELILSYYQKRAYPNSGTPSRHRRELMFLRVGLASFFDEAKNGSAGSCVEQSAELLNRFLRRRGFRREDLFVVTTNYDLVMERIFELNFGPASWCYPGLMKDSDCVDRIPIFKLHGSINWMEDRGLANEMAASRPKLPPRILEPRSLSVIPVPPNGYYLGHEARKYTPILVPPLYQKDYWFGQDNESWSNIFRPAWKGAFAGLRASTSRLFWGYSLPAADLDMFTELMDISEASSADTEIVDACDDTHLIKLGRYHLGSKLKVFPQGLVDYLWRR